MAQLFPVIIRTFGKADWNIQVHQFDESTRIKQVSGCRWKLLECHGMSIVTYL